MSSNSYGGSRNRRRKRDDAFDRQEGICGYCGEPIQKHDAIGDHALPTSMGGTNALWNIVAACFACDKAKGNLSADEFERILTQEEPPQSFLLFAAWNRRKLWDLHQIVRGQKPGNYAKLARN